MDVEDLLARAWAAVEKAGIPEPLQEYAFKEALSRLADQSQKSTKDVVAKDPVGHGSGREHPAGGAEVSDTKSDSDLFAKFAKESGVEVTNLERIFYFNNGIPHLNGPRGKFGKTTADQAKVLAVALTAAYDYALDKHAPDDVVRTEAVRLKCDLGGNWARAMNSLSAVSWIGAARQKQFKVKSDTPEALKKIVADILGQSAE